MPIQTNDAILTFIQDKMNAGKWICIATTGANKNLLTMDDENKRNLADGNHAYYLKDVPGNSMTLLNPWGTDRTVTLPKAYYDKVITTVYVIDPL